MDRLSDAIVVGGGATGAGVARDLALRGLSVLLLEKDDWGGGWPPGWMLGPSAWREPAADRTAATEAGHVARIARHLVRRCAALLPVLPDDRLGVERLEAAVEMRDRLQPLRGLRPHLRLTGDEARRLEPGLAPAVAAALTVEDWAVDPHRLVWANVLDAVRAGARALNHTEVEAMLRDAGGVIGVRCRAADGQRSEIRARVVVNAAGPWAPRVAALAGASVRVRPLRAVQVVFDRRVTNFALSCSMVDGREVALVPFGDATVLGSTSDDYAGDLDVVEVQPDDVDQLLAAAERVLPAIRAHRPARAAAGVRPTLLAWGEPARDGSARSEVLDHERLDGVAGLVTVAWDGDLARYRLMAERAADAVCARLGVQTRSATASRPLPGASGTPPPVHELTAEHGLSALAATRLLARHGTEAPDVLQDARRGRLVCRCQALTEAELAHAVRGEQVRTLADAFRRVGLGAGPCAGAACLERGAEVMGHELGWSAAQRREAARDFQVAAWRDRAPVLDRSGWAEEELAYGLRRGWPGTL